MLASSQINPGRVLAVLALFAALAVGSLLLASRATVGGASEPGGSATASAQVGTAQPHAFPAASRR